jgi:hypothetical protein
MQQYTLRNEYSRSVCISFSFKGQYFSSVIKVQVTLYLNSGLVAAYGLFVTRRYFLVPTLLFDFRLFVRATNSLAVVKLTSNVLASKSCNLVNTAGLREDSSRDVKLSRSLI